MRRRAAGAPSTTRTGALAEAVGAEFLGGRGLHLVTRNFRCRCGEIDLVMMDGPELVIVEVRYRASASLVDPALTITAPKRRRLLQSAQRYLQEQPRFADHPIRFDVLSISGPLQAPRCTWYRGAFSADDAGHR